MVLKTVAIRRRSGSEKFVWTRGSSSPGCTALIVDSSSRIGLKASRRIRKLPTRMATGPIASRPRKKGNGVRREKFSVISGPLIAPAAMMALFATTTFWNVVRLRCHHRGSNEVLTIHSRHGLEGDFELGPPNQFRPKRNQVRAGCRTLVNAPQTGYRYAGANHPPPPFAARLPNGPLLLFNGRTP